MHPTPEHFLPHVVAAGAAAPSAVRAGVGMQLGGQWPDVSLGMGMGMDVEAAPSATGGRCKVREAVPGLDRVMSEDTSGTIAGVRDIDRDIGPTVGSVPGGHKIMFQCVKYHEHMEAGGALSQASWLLG